MDFAYSDEQEELRKTLRRFLEERAPAAEVRRVAETPAGYDASVWRQLCDELGLAGVHVPEACGGQGLGMLELGIVQEELGRALLPSPYFASVCLAASAVLCVGSEPDRRRLLPDLAAGRTLGALAWLERGSGGNGWEAGDVRLEAPREAGELVLDGVKHCVVDGQNADLLLVAVRRPGSHGDAGISLAEIERGAPGVHVEPLDTLDATRRLARIEFSGARARLVGAEGEAGPGLAKTLARACVCLAAEQVGGAARCLELAIEYAKVRVQFARTIGSFQAVQHKAAEVLLEVESARAAVAWASWVAEQEEAELPLAASLARGACTDAYLRAAWENIHIHGGIGVTWENDAHLYYRRAKSSEILLGDAAHHRARIVRELGFRT